MILKDYLRLLQITYETTYGPKEKEFLIASVENIPDITAKEITHFHFWHRRVWLADGEFDAKTQTLKVIFREDTNNGPVRRFDPDATLRSILSQGRELNEITRLWHNNSMATISKQDQGICAIYRS